MSEFWIKWSDFRYLNLDLPIFAQRSGLDKEALEYLGYMTQTFDGHYLLWEGIRDVTLVTIESIQKILANGAKGAFVINSPYPFLPPEKLIPKEIPKNLVEQAWRMLFKIFQETSQNFESVQGNVKSTMLWLLAEKKTEIEIPPGIESIITEVVEALCQKENLIHLGSLSELNKKFEGTTVHSLGVALRTALNGDYLMQNYPKISEKYKLKNRNDLVQLTMGWLLHDIGKILIPKEIIEKKGALTSEEREIVNSHSILWYLLLSNNGQKQDTYARIAKEHHCSYGNSFDLHPFSQIIKIIDVMDALWEDRSYRKAKSPFYALKIELQNFKMREYNPELFPIFYERTLATTPSFLIKNLCMKISQENLNALKMQLAIETENDDDLYAIVLESESRTRAKCAIVEIKKDENWKLDFKNGKVFSKKVWIDLAPELKQELTGWLSCLEEIFQNLISDDFLINHKFFKNLPN